MYGMTNIIKNHRSPDFESRQDVAKILNSSLRGVITIDSDQIKTFLGIASKVQRHSDVAIAINKLHIATMLPLRFSAGSHSRAVTSPTRWAAEQNGLLV
jgi:hypothetical protein